MKFTKSWAAAAAIVTLTGATQAALLPQGNGTVLDTNTNLIWLQNWNVNGLQFWATQKAWAETTLDGFAGSNDWRLPGIAEYANLFNAYGNLTSNTLPFVNVQPLSGYWSGTEVIPGNVAWFFVPDLGFQRTDNEIQQYFAVAVRPVPEPQTYALMLMGLGAVLLALRRRPR